jgi:hypothetical protein
MPVVLKRPDHSPFRRSHATRSDASQGTLVFVGVFLIIGMAFVYGLVSLRQTPNTSTTVPDELLSLSRKAHIVDQGY